MLFGLFLCIGAVLAQTRVSGVVIAASDNQPLFGARVSADGGRSFTATDEDGKFSLTIKGKNLNVTVSYLGMQSQTLKGATDMKISLKDAQSLGEVVVTGLTKTDRRMFTGAADKVDAATARLSAFARRTRCWCLRTKREWHLWCGS